MMSQLRYRFVKAMHGLSFLKKVKEEAVIQLLGHSKIIGWEDNLPVRSLSIPAEYSPVQQKSMARLVNSLRSGVQAPGLASLSITDTCDYSCDHCFAYDQPGRDLSTEEWKNIISQSLEMGAFTIIINGGEPLMRPDLPEIISSIDRQKATCLLYTNGSMLKSRVKELYAAGLRRVAVSIDFPSAKAHDNHRHKSGAFDAAIAGIHAAKKQGMLTALSTFVSPERLYDGTLEGILRLSLELKVNEVIIYDLLPVGKQPSCGSIKNTNPKYYHELRQLIEKWWQIKKAPGIWWYGHLVSPGNYGCPGGTSMFSISHSGDFKACDFSRESVGNIANNDISSLWTSLRSSVHEKKSCNSGCMILSEPNHCPSTKG
ncbi:MAG: radical SAM protein [Planctomycetes bacterium]|nr:radical SAM protein [Planctomycetota bacterium]